MASEVIDMSLYEAATQVESEPDRQFDGIPASVRAAIMSYQRPDNHYGEGSAATSLRDCREAIELLAFAKKQNPNIDMPASISPSTHGGISLYWQKEDCQLSIEVSAANSTDISYQYVSPEGLFSVGTDTRERLVAKLSSIFPR